MNTKLVVKSFKSTTTLNDAYNMYINLLIKEYGDDDVFVDKDRYSDVWYAMNELLIEIEDVNS